MELIGPIAAQKKYDAIQSKNFLALDPSVQGKAGHRARSRSMGSRRGRNQETKEVLLCPFDEHPVKRTLSRACQYCVCLLLSVFVWLWTNICRVSFRIWAKGGRGAKQ